MKFGSKKPFGGKGRKPGGRPTDRSRAYKGGESGEKRGSDGDSRSRGGFKGKSDFKGRSDFKEKSGFKGKPDFKKRDRDGEKPEFKPKRDFKDQNFKDRDSGERKPFKKDGFRKDRDGDKPSFRPKRDFRDRDSGSRDSGERGERDSRDRKPFARDGFKKDGFKKDGFKKGGFKKDGFRKDYSRDDKPRSPRRFEDKDRDRGGNRPPRRHDQPQNTETAPRAETLPHVPERERATIYGTHAVTEAWLNPAREITALYITPPLLEEFKPVLDKADILGLSRPEPTIMDKHKIDRFASKDAVHQGIALAAEPLDEQSVGDFIRRAEGESNVLLIMLDQVTDPHNVGAIIRSASALGADGMIMQRKHAPSLTGVLAKTASGGLEHMPIATETNLSRALEELKEAGFFAFGLDERGQQSVNEVKRGGRVVLVLGAEGSGLRPLVREHCDSLLRLPTVGAIQSLNVSNAAAVALFALSAKI